MKAGMTIRLSTACLSIVKVVQQGVCLPFSTYVMSTPTLTDQAISLGVTTVVEAMAPSLLGTTSGLFAMAVATLLRLDIMD